jgi:hypothetical protein
MKKEKESRTTLDRKTVFSEKEFQDYLEERFRKLKLDEQKFRDEVLTKNILPDKSDQYTKLS